MAYFQERDNGTVTARIRRHGVMKSETFTAKADAEAWARKVESEIERGLWRDSTEAERTTLAEALDRYEREKTGEKRGEVQERSVLRGLRDEPLSRLTLARIRSADVATMAERWKRAGLAPATVRRRLSVLSHVFATAAREWGMENLANPVALLKLPPLRNARERRVSDEEINAVIAASNSALLPPVMRLAVETAMRRGEIVGMRWEHVDLRRRVAHLPETKNGTSRDVPLSRAAGAVLEALPRRLDGCVFGCRQDVITQAFARACERAEIEDLRFHDLRHEATSRLAERLEMHELMKVTGHKDPRMLARYYHPRAADLAKKLD